MRAQENKTVYSPYEKDSELLKIIGSREPMDHSKTIEKDHWAQEEIVTMGHPSCWKVEVIYPPFSLCAEESNVSSNKQETLEQKAMSPNQSPLPYGVNN